MKNSIIRIVFALAAGLMLAIWPDLAADYLVIFIGVLFFLPGLIGTISYFVRKKDAGEPSPKPIAAICSTLLGLWILLMPELFGSLLMFLIGFVLMIGGLQQIFVLMSARKWTNVPMVFYIIPSLIFLSGILILFNPTEARNTAFLIVGITSIVYAVSELINYMKFSK